MKKLISSSLCAVMFTVLCAPTAFAGALDDLRGAWSLMRTNENNEAYTQKLEIDKDKFIFKIISADKKTVLFARGDVKVETHNSLSLISFTQIVSGESADQVSPVDDDRHCIYFLDGDSLSLAVDFDKAREKTPRIEVYTKVKK